MHTAKREYIHTATIDFGSISAGATAEVVVETGLHNLLACAVNPSDGLLDAGLMVAAYAVPPRNEVQNVTTDGTGGSFTLTLDAVESGAIGFDATAEEVALAFDGVANVSVVKNGASDWDIEFLSFGEQSALVPDDTLLTGETTGTVATEVTKGRARGTAIVRCANVSAAPIDPASQDFQLVCWT